MLVGSIADRYRKSGSDPFSRDIVKSISKEMVERDRELSRKSAWVRVGHHVTGIPDPEYPYDLESVRAIRRFDPALVPIFRKVVYKAPSGGTRVFRHHGLGVYEPEMEGIPALQGIPMPADCEWPRPTSVVRWFEGAYVKGSYREKIGLPRPFVPWGDWVLQWVMETRWEASAKEKRQYIDENGPDAVAARELAHEQSEAAYRAESEGLTVPKMRRKLEDFTSDEWRELKARQAGTFPTESESKVYSIPSAPSAPSPLPPSVPPGTSPGGSKE